MTFSAPGAYADDRLSVQKRDGACSLQSSSVSTTGLLPVMSLHLVIVDGIES